MSPKKIFVVGMMFVIGVGVLLVALLLFPGNEMGRNTDSGKHVRQEMDRMVGDMVIPAGNYDLENSEKPARVASELFGDSAVRGAYMINTHHTYQNEDLGFSVDLPERWARYAVRESRDSDSAEVVFGLPVDGDSMVGVNRWDDPEYVSMVLDVYSIRIVPVLEFDARVKKCTAPDIDYPCHVDIEIARTATHVYAGHQVNVDWIPCVDAEDLAAEPYACSVYGDFFLPLQKSDTFRKSFTLTR
ncbi:MAG: hypothetical protein HGA33_05860 [Candidatus Moranbacteria bacterium]|nr:hypothetical protein [Candidatus Moranbacteria bacterium]